MPVPVALLLVAAAMLSMAQCKSAPQAARPAQTDAVVQSAAEDRRDDCDTQANLFANVAPARGSKTWPASTRATLQPEDFGAAFPNTDDLVVTVAGDRVAWKAKPGVVVCYAAISLPETNKTGVFQAVPAVTGASGSFSLPAKATAVTVQGWLPTAGPGIGTNAPGRVPSDFGPLQLKNCLEHGNVVGTVMRDPKTGRWQIGTVHTIIRGQADQRAQSLTALLGRKNYAKYAVASRVVACQAEITYHGKAPFITEANRAGTIYSSPLSTLNAYTILVYDPRLPDGQGDLTQHQRR